MSSIKIKGYDYQWHCRVSAPIHGPSLLCLFIMLFRDTSFSKQILFITFEIWMGKVLSKLQHRIGLHSLVPLFGMHKIWLLIRIYELNSTQNHFTRALSEQLRIIFDFVATGFCYDSMANGSIHLTTCTVVLGFQQRI